MSKEIELSAELMQKMAECRTAEQQKTEQLKAEQQMPEQTVGGNAEADRLSDGTLDEIAGGGWYKHIPSKPLA